MSELNLQPETTQIDTNTEYILPAEEKKQPPVLLSVSKAIIVETVKDFFRSIIGFFLRYIRHFIRCLVYFVNPSLQKKPFNKLDFKENSQHAFEFVLIVLASIIFMEKVDWIPTASKELLEQYNNDLSQKVLEVFLFVFFALSYLLLAFFAIMIGRFFKMLFRVKLTHHESDILMVYLNNAFFSIGAIIALVLRCMASLEVYDSDGLAKLLIMICGPIAFILSLVWAVRFAILHRLGFGRGTGFVLGTAILYGALYFVITFLLVTIVLAL